MCLKGYFPAVSGIFEVEPIPEGVGEEELFKKLSEQYKVIQELQFDEVIKDKNDNNSDE